jgi:hypothetical protein
MAQTPVEDRLGNPNQKVYFTELLRECGKRKTRADRIAILKKYHSKNSDTKLVVQKVMEWLTNDMVKIEIPSGDVPFQTNKTEDYTNVPLMLQGGLDRAKYFVKGCPSYIESTIKREHFFIQTLESLYTDDAVLLVGLKDKEIVGFHGVTAQLLIDAFESKASSLGNE